MMREPLYDLDGCLRLLAAVVRQEISEARGDPIRLSPIAYWLGMPVCELQRRWSNRKNAHGVTYGIQRRDFNGQ